MVGGFVQGTEGLGRNGDLSLPACAGAGTQSQTGTYAISPPASEAFGLGLGPGGHCCPGSLAHQYRPWDPPPHNPTSPFLVLFLWRPWLTQRPFWAALTKSQTLCPKRHTAHAQGLGPSQPRRVSLPGWAAGACVGSLWDPRVAGASPQRHMELAGVQGTRKCPGSPQAPASCRCSGRQAGAGATRPGTRAGGGQRRQCRTGRCFHRPVHVPGAKAAHTDRRGWKSKGRATN